MSNQELNSNKFYIWQGIYPGFKEALSDARGVGFSGEVYRSRSLAVASECLNALKQGTPIPAFHKQRSTFMPLTAAMMMGGEKNIRILDFGGGLGIGYMVLVESMPTEMHRVNYMIVEVPEVCAIAAPLFDGVVNYTKNLPQNEHFDLIHAASSFQYVEQWQDLVHSFAKLSPEYILLSDVFAGTIKTFATLQNYYENLIPHWFLNLDELLAEFEARGYSLVMKNHVTARRLDVEDKLPMDNFPVDHRLPNTLHLLFHRKTGDANLR